MWETLKDVTNTALDSYDRYVDTTTKAEQVKIQAKTNQASSASESELKSYLAQAQAYKWYIIAGVAVLVCVLFGVSFLKKRF